MSQGVLVFVEHRNGAFSKHAIEAIAAAQYLGSQLTQPVIAVVTGGGMSSLAQEVASYDVSKVIYADNTKLADYTPDGYTDSIESVIRKVDPHLVVLPHTYLVRDFAPKLAARFGKSLISDCVRAQVTDGTAVFTRRIFLGKMDADVISDGESPVFVTFQSGAYRADQAAKEGEAPVETQEVEVGIFAWFPKNPSRKLSKP